MISDEIETLKKRKGQLEAEISVAIWKFLDDTGLEIDSIKFSIDKLPTTHTHRVFTEVGIKGVKLEHNKAA